MKRYHFVTNIVHVGPLGTAYYNRAAMVEDLKGEYVRYTDLQAMVAAPVPMLLWCPRCNTQHVDAPSPGWDNPPHRTHRCAACTYLWRPCDVATAGVARIASKGGGDMPADPNIARSIRRMT